MNMYAYKECENVYIIVPESMSTDGMRDQYPKPRLILTNDNVCFADTG